MFKSRRYVVSNENNAASRKAGQQKNAVRGDFALGGRRGLRDITNNTTDNGGAQKAGDVAKKAREETKEADAAAMAPSASLPLMAAAGASSRSSTRRVDDIDARDSDNPAAVTDYVEDMYAYFRDREYRTGVSPNYMRQQSHINEKMRAILIDWLVSPAPSPAPTERSQSASQPRAAGRGHAVALAAARAPSRLASRSTARPAGVPDRG